MSKYLVVKNEECKHEGDNYVSTNGPICADCMDTDYKESWVSLEEAIVDLLKDRGTVTSPLVLALERAY